MSTALHKALGHAADTIVAYGASYVTAEMPNVKRIRVADCALQGSEWLWRGRSVNVEIAYGAGRDTEEARVAAETRLVHVISVAKRNGPAAMVWYRGHVDSPVLATWQIDEASANPFKITLFMRVAY